jgi:hypothetical protein
MAVEIFVVRVFRPAHRLDFPSKPPWDFLQFLGRHPAVFDATGIPDVAERIARNRLGATGACVINETVEVMAPRD